NAPRSPEVRQNKKPCPPPAGTHVDNWRIRQPHHGAADLPAKQKWIGIDEHRLKFPLGLIENWKLLWEQIDGFLNNVIGQKRSRDGVVPLAFVQLRSKIKPASAVVVVWLKHK